VLAPARSGQSWDPEIVLFGVDRLDYTKGILHRLKAYEELLDGGRLGPPQAVFVQVAGPSRERVEQYQLLRAEVEGIVGRINGNHATLGQPAVHYLHHSYPREEIAALYLAADVMLVTSLRDGMNLVARSTWPAATTRAVRWRSVSSPAPRTSWAAPFWSTRTASRE
jgi:trehalose 6-phosphate synthase